MSAEWSFTFQHLKFPLLPLLTHSAMILHVFKNMTISIKSLIYSSECINYLKYISVYLLIMERPSKKNVFPEQTILVIVVDNVVSVVEKIVWQCGDRDEVAGEGGKTFPGIFWSLCWLWSFFTSPDFLWLVLKQLVEILLMLLAAWWCWSLGPQGGRSPLVGYEGARLAKEATQALLQLEGELLELGEGGEEWFGESLRQECAQYCCWY